MEVLEVVHCQEQLLCHPTPVKLATLSPGKFSMSSSHWFLPIIPKIVDWPMVTASGMHKMIEQVCFGFHSPEVLISTRYLQGSVHFQELVHRPLGLLPIKAHTCMGSQAVKGVCQVHNQLVIGRWLHFLKQASQCGQEWLDAPALGSFAFQAGTVSQAGP